MKWLPPSHHNLSCHSIANYTFILNTVMVYWNAFLLGSPNIAIWTSKSGFAVSFADLLPILDRTFQYIIVFGADFKIISIFSFR